MKKKVFTVLLSAMLVTGSAGSTMAAEKISCSEILKNLKGESIQAVLQNCFAKYFDGELPQLPETSLKPESPEKPESSEKPGDSGNQQPEQNGGSRVSQVVNLVNQERSSAGLGTLTADSQLSRLAQLKAEDMAKNGYFSHTSPTYGSAFDMMQDAGYSYRTAGENIAKGQKTADAVMEGWMNSSGHRANILSSSYTKIGVGWAADESGTPYWVQIFAG